MHLKSFFLLFFTFALFNCGTSAQVKTNTEKTSNTIDHEIWNDVLQKFVSNTGQVNYKGLKSDSSGLYNYIFLLKNNPPQNDWSRQEKLAYWINAYNALTIDLILRNHPLKSIKDIDNPWNQELWKIGNDVYSLNDIEHQILRKMDEPRIHFAIVCASISCPKLQNTAFTARDLESQLTNATKEFLLDPSKNKITKSQLEISKIFKWFTKDFKSSESTVIDFINRYTDVTISEDAEISYMEYNWNLND
ncbi:DUF547 domain-containing protein [Psychroserpens sp. XS_ASV72]|uniref:DUF547 domain-containing protein n=1 Tax=Psychroserpens sp. XS_ASV72 TaxID=3241293 RepID=UPI003517F4CC